ncbi:MAG: hypothetical protein P1U56_08870 [Saprospiraceae bacterium]|nr:hypothetical protein [Saprospiraceae bacterium]
MKVIKILLLSMVCSISMFAQTDQPPTLSGDTVIINMAALDQPFMYNRLGTSQPTGMIFALETDIVPKKGKIKKAGNVRLIDHKRPRPIVLRANVGDVLVINFTNYLRPFPKDTTSKFYEVEFYDGWPTPQETVNSIYPATRFAGVHIIGTEWANSSHDDASFVGDNQNSLVPASESGMIGPDQSTQYMLIAAAEGTYVLHSTADNIADGTIRAGQISNGLFGSLVVEPPQAEWYRSQVTQEELFDATMYWVTVEGDTTYKKDLPAGFNQENVGFPIIDYGAVDSNGKPILQMYEYQDPKKRPHVRTLIASDLTAMITGPNAGDFPIYDESPSFFNVPASPNRRQAYREFSIHYHEAPYAVQAFPEFYNKTGDPINDITQTIQGGVDQFAFNYGTGGIGAEIYANRAKVGPMAECVDCAYEEFFLSAWAVGDPAQVVDIPANALLAAKGSDQDIEQIIDSTLQDLMLRDAALLESGALSVDNEKLDTDLRATKVLYPDDPSNVYHSYMSDHVKFRINHCGAGITHVHHQHAHQWLHSPNSDKGHYLDSQTINPGSSYTLEMVYSGSGNLNKTVGDQIFHCHFYPHFAQGMWAMWRVHDVLEVGTVMNDDGTIAENSRAYPDNEIYAGTPIPGLVPISTLPMAPLPGKVTLSDKGQIQIEDKDRSPGYPFYIPGVAGQRAPHPPLDFARGEVTTTSGVTHQDTFLNGGLPRNVIIDGKTVFENHTRYDWTKITDSLQVIQLPEEGTYYEKLAMEAHATRTHKTLTPTGRPGSFILNGLPPVSGAPFADPAVDENGYAVGTLRRYKAANIQVDAVLNELGWHYPQQRPIVLWGDVASTIAGEKPPEPFFMRANSGEYVEFWSTNLVPEYYELDDYQVRTPTDIIGQHIHLVKFDVTSSDGAANGWNYEDGTLATDLVRDHIKEINKGKRYVPNLEVPYDGALNTLTYNPSPSNDTLVAYKPMAIWGDAPPGQNWIGAQTTIQRWYSNPLYDNEGVDRTLRTVFTHDHFGPSTHQQIGLYAGLLIEPAGSEWLSSSTGELLGFAQLDSSRYVQVGYTPEGAPISGKTMSIMDGGPTDWQAIISMANPEDSYREFMFEFQDNQQAYLAGSIDSMNMTYPEWDPPANATEDQLTDYREKFRTNVNDNYRGWIDFDHAITPPPKVYNQPAPELVTTGNRGTLSLNYRNSPLPVRVAPGGGEHSSDLAYAFSSLLDRGVDAMNSQPVGGANIAPGVNKFKWPVNALNPGMEDGDPYTPLARAYNGDKIQIRTLVGAHVNPHFFNIHGVKWYFEPSFENSGFRSTQMMSLSEHFEMNFKLPYPKGNSEGNTDYLYLTNADDNGLQAGTWGLMRSYRDKLDDLHELPNNKLNPKVKVPASKSGCGCPDDAPVRTYDVTAISIDKYQQNGPNWGILTYNKAHRNFDSKAIIFINTDEIELFKNSMDYEPRPLVLRANAGDCLKVKVRNDITPDFVNNTGSITYASLQDTTYKRSIVKKKVKIDTIITTPNKFDYETSFTVGMHAELLTYDVSTSDGTSVGQNALGTQLLAQNYNNDYVDYTWYAGQWNSDGKAFTPEPVELGTVVLTAPDPLLQYVSGLFGALIVEPEHSYWVEDENNPTSANIYKDKKAFKEGDDPLFREFVLMFQDNISVPSEPMVYPDSTIIVTGETATSGLNYKSEPLANREFFNAQGQNNFNQVDVYDIVSNFTVLAAPETPTFVAEAGTPVRFRVMYPGGVGDGTTFDLHGHVWQEEPYTDRSTKMGFNPKSQWLGARGQLGALNSFDLLINSAGGTNAVTGDYLYRDYRNQTFQDGIWGIFKVSEGLDVPMVTRITNFKDGTTEIRGINTVNPRTGKMADFVQIAGEVPNVAVHPYTGEWTATVRDFSGSNLKVTSVYFNEEKGGSVSYDRDQISQLTAPPTKRVEMKAPVRSALKLVEPGSNKDGVINRRK